MPVSKEKQEALQRRMNDLGVREDDLIEKFVLGSGKGGQKANKTASCVYLKHIPSQLEVKCQRDRSREMNRFLARRELCEQITEKVHQEKTARKKEVEKLRRQKKRRSRRLKQKILEEKRRRSEIKSLRSAPSPDEH